jgi:hypothetical protein
VAADDSIVRVEIGISADDDQYVRQSCPSCALEFKVQGDEADFKDALGWWASRAMREGGFDAEVPALTTRLCCPYCRHEADRQDFLHDETQDYVRRIALREVLEPLIFRHLEDVERPFSGGFVTFRAVGTDSRSPRPISGPEPNDMVRVCCFSCEARFKLNEGWAYPVVCPACFVALVLT